MTEKASLVTKRNHSGSNGYPVGASHSNMFASKRQSLADWIDAALNDSDKPGPCTMMGLCHVVGQSEREVHTVLFHSDRPDTRTPSQLADLFDGKMHSYAQDLQGAQSFMLKAFYAGDNVARAFRPILITPEPSQVGMTSHPPTAEGLTMASMNHTQAVLSITSRQQVVLSQSWENMVGRLSDMVDNLQRELAMVREENRKLVVDHLRELHAMRIKEAEFSRETQERMQLFKVVPGLVNSIAGREVFSQSTIDTNIVEAIATKITPEDVNMLVAMGKLTKEEAALLLSRFQQIAEERAIQDKKARELAEHAIAQAGSGDVPELSDVVPPREVTT